MLSETKLVCRGVKTCRIIFLFKFLSVELLINTYAKDVEVLTDDFIHLSLLLFSVRV